MSARRPPDSGCWVGCSAVAMMCRPSVCDQAKVSRYASFRESGNRPRRYPAAMKVLLRNPRREVEVVGPMTVDALLRNLELNPESVLVIVGDELVTHDIRLGD